MKKLVLAISMLSLLISYGCNRGKEETTETSTQEQTERYPSEAGGTVDESVTPEAGTMTEPEGQTDMDTSPDAQMETERPMDSESMDSESMDMDTNMDTERTDSDVESDSNINP